MPTIARAPIAVLPNAGMSQSSLMVAALIGGFIVYLGFAGKLQAYWSLLIGGGSGSAAAAPATSSGSGATTIVPPVIPGVPNSGLTFKWTNPFGPGGIFGPPATTPAPSTGGAQ